MVSPQHKNRSNRKKMTVLTVALALALVPVGVQATSLQEQINAAKAEEANNSAQASTLRAQGDTLAGKLAEIQGQVSSIRSQIATSKAKQQQLTQAVDEAKNKLAIKKQVLDENVRVIYQESKVSPLEMLASSKSFSEYVDRQQYLDTLKDHVQEATKQVQRQKEELERQKADLEIAIKKQNDLSQALAIQQNEQSNLLASTRGSEARYAEQARASSERVKELERQQAAILAARFGGIPSGGSPCGGGYPAKWCNAPINAYVDSWGMYSRQCVSYTAFRVANSGRYMPYWGGRGHAKQWPDNARAAGISVDNNPRVGDVAITLEGPYGHAMYVESVSGNMVTVSQYNFGNAGEYSTMTISKNGLYFIHF